MPIKNNLLEKIKNYLIILIGDQIRVIQLNLLVETLLYFEFEYVFGKKLMYLLIGQINANLW